MIGGDQELLMLLPEQSRDLSRRDVRIALARALEAPRRQTGVDVRLKNKTTGRYEHEHIAHWSLTLAPEDMSPAALRHTVELGSGAVHREDGSDRLPLRRRAPR